MAIDLITGHQGVAHISAEQIANINNALMDDYGVDKVVRLDDGTLTQDGLTINVGTGFWRVNGFDMEIQEAETVYIDPTATGLSRIDNIYVEILQDIPTGSQRSEIVTVQGEAAASPVAPDAPTAPVLNTDILLQVTPLATVTVTEGAMVMTDLSVAYEIVTPQELAAVETIAENAQTAAGNAQKTANTASTNASNALGMIRSTSSDAYSSSKAYSVGNHVIYNNKVYKCITACSAAAWSVNQNCFEPTTLTKAVTDLNNDLKGKVLATVTANGTKTYRQLLNELFSQISPKLSQLTAEEKSQLKLSEGSGTKVCNYSTSTELQFYGSNFSAMYTSVLNASNSSERHVYYNNGNNIIDDSTNTAPNGLVFKIFL